MSELLRLANELIEARRNAPQGPWVCTEYTINAGDGWSIFFNDERLTQSSEFIVRAGNNAVDIIKGYQDLMRRMAFDLDACLTYVENDKLADGARSRLDKARASIPEEP